MKVLLALVLELGLELVFFAATRLEVPVDHLELELRLRNYLAEDLPEGGPR